MARMVEGKKNTRGSEKTTGIIVFLGISQNPCKYWAFKRFDYFPLSRIAACGAVSKRGKLHIKEQ